MSPVTKSYILKIDLYSLPWVHVNRMRMKLNTSCLILAYVTFLLIIYYYLLTIENCAWLNHYELATLIIYTPADARTCLKIVRERSITGDLYSSQSKYNS